MAQRDQIHWNLEKHPQVETQSSHNWCEIVDKCVLLAVCSPFVTSTAAPSHYCLTSLFSKVAVRLTSQGLRGKVCKKRLLTSEGQFQAGLLCRWNVYLTQLYRSVISFCLKSIKSSVCDHDFVFIVCCGCNFFLFFHIFQGQKLFRWEGKFGSIHFYFIYLVKITTIVISRPLILEGKDHTAYCTVIQGNPQQSDHSLCASTALGRFSFPLPI